MLRMLDQLIMAAHPALQKPLHVMVATPAGGAGQGGIDRIMAALQRELARHERSDLDVTFQATRGEGHVALSPFHLLAFCVKMAAKKAAGRVDVVHINLSSHGSTWRKLVVAACARLLAVPYVLHLHGSRYQTFWKANGLASRIIRWMFEHAARIIVLGTLWRDFIAARAPSASGPVVIVPNATERPVLPHRGGGDTVHILFLGRLGARKGVPELLAALRQLAGIGGWRATIAGDGEITETRRKVLNLKLDDRIDVPGWVGPEQVAALIAGADILALPSHAENLPISVIEAMADGLAVVTTPVGAVEDIITDGETGLLVSPGDAEALALALRRLLEDPILRIRLGAAAQALHRSRLELGPFADALHAVWKEAARRA